MNAFFGSTFSLPDALIDWPSLLRNRRIYRALDSLIFSKILYIIFHSFYISVVS